MKVLVASLSDSSTDPRPSRMIDFLLDEGYEVDVLGYKVTLRNALVGNYFEIETSPGGAVSNFTRRASIAIAKLLPNWRRLESLKDALNDIRCGVLAHRDSLGEYNYNLIVVEDLQLLPLAFKIKRTAKVLFDAREYYPLQYDESWKFRVFEKPERVRLCRRYLQRCDFAMTVSDGLADKYVEEFDTPMVVYRSVPRKYSHTSSRATGAIIKMVHHGVANRNRKIERMITIAGACDATCSLDLFLVGDQKYISELKLMSERHDNVKVRDPIKFSDLSSRLIEYDVGFYMLEPTSFNLRYALPNKLFEYIQAGLAVIIGPSPEMAGIVTRYECGFVLPSFNLDEASSMLKKLEAGQIENARMKSRTAAEELCYESEQKVLISILDGVNHHEAKSSRPLRSEQ